MPFPFLPIRTAHPEGIVLVQASTGKVMLYGDNVATSDGFYDDCCCEVAAPCTCPCGSWLPVSWPCGGLVEEYEIGNNFTSPEDGADIWVRETKWTNADCTGPILDWYEYRGNSTITVTANAFYASCGWEGSTGHQVRTKAAPTWAPYGNPAVLRLNTVGCYWYAYRGGIDASRVLRRDTRVTPVGVLTLARVCWSAGSNYWTTEGACTVVEAAP